MLHLADTDTSHLSHCLRACNTCRIRRFVRHLKPVYNLAPHRIMITINYFVMHCLLKIPSEIRTSAMSLLKSAGIYLNNNTYMSMYMYVPFCVFCVFCVLFVCEYVLYCCHRVSTQLQLNISYISYRIISYHIISYHISYHIYIIYHIVSYHIIYHIISYRIVSYHIISYRIISYRIVSHHITSHHIISYYIISYHIIS
jgi:hypothetical protein